MYNLYTIYDRMLLNYWYFKLRYQIIRRLLSGLFSAELLMLEPYSVIACVLAFVLELIVYECYHFDYNVDQTETVIISNRFIAY